MPLNGDHDLVVIGASAGGVEAFTYIVQQLPSDFRAAIVLILHLGPDSPNMLPWLMSRRSKLHVITPHDHEPLRHGHIYVAVPDRHLTFEDQAIRITMGPKENRHRPAIDTTFRSAARWFGRRVVGVVLTGSLDDGAHGLALIKRKGGTAIVQAPEDAAFPSMPKSAITADHPDYVVPLSEIPALLLQLCANAEKQPNTAASVPRNPMTRFSENPQNETPRIPDEGSDYQPGGEPSVYTCPECSGTLFQNAPRNGNELFECRVGHRYTLPALLNDNYDAVERALWIAMRALEEAASLSGHMAESARKRGQTRTAELYAQQARERQEQVESIRQVIFRSEPLPVTKSNEVA